MVCEVGLHRLCKPHPREQRWGACPGVYPRACGPLARMSSRQHLANLQFHPLPSNERNEMKLTVPQLTALQAVRDGKVQHIFHEKGNLYRGHSGLGARSFADLDVMGLIEDGRGSKWARIYAVNLTDAGRGVLADSTSMSTK